MAKSSSLGRMGVSRKDWGLRAHISGSVINGALSQWHTCIPGKVEIGRKQAGGGQCKADMFQVGSSHQRLKGCLLIK